MRMGRRRRCDEVSVCNLSLCSSPTRVATLVVQAEGLEELGSRIGQRQGSGSQDLGNGRSLDHLVAQGITTHHCIEAVMRVRGVVHSAQVSIGIDQCVLALDLVALARLRLALDVAGVLVVHRVGKVIVGGRLHLDGLQQGLNEGRRVVAERQLNGGGGTNAQDEQRKELEFMFLL